jgi:hypothetical protein
MATERTVIPGIVKNGMVVPQNDTPLPEGAHVDILIHSADMPPNCSLNWTSGIRPATRHGR